MLCKPLVGGSSPSAGTLDRAPAVRLLKEPTRRIRFLTHDQPAALLEELPAHLRDMATFTLATGLRAANETGLTWEQGDLDRKVAWVHPDQAKARKAIAVPLNAAAIAVIGRQRGKHAERVFTYEGAPVRHHWGRRSRSTRSHRAF